VCPLHIERDLASPADLVAIIGIERRQAIGRDLGKGRIRQTKDAVKGGQVGR